jgi:putative nucleotidyltransferase with HDIG domain
LASTTDAVFISDNEGRFIEFNEAFATFHKFANKDDCAKTLAEYPEFLDVLLPNGELAPLEQWAVPRALRGETATHAVYTLRRKDTGETWVGSYSFAPMRDKDGVIIGAVVAGRDITPQKRAEAKIAKLNLLLEAIKDINEALLRAKSEPELFQQTCDLLLKVPYVIFSWIGLVQPDSHEIKAVAWAGAEEGYLSIIKVAWDDSEYGRGPTGQAIRTGQPVIRRNLDPIPYPHPWKEEALKRGYLSSIALPLTYEGEVIGILKGYSGVTDAFGEKEIEFLNQVAGDIVVGIRSLRLEQELIESLIKLQVTMLQTIEAISSMAELRDPYTAGHQKRVTQLALALAQEMGLAPDRIEGLRVASLIHDIGKIVVPAEILNRPGKLSEYEMNIVRIHSEAGFDIIKKIDFPWPVAQVVLQHHERLNGSGYPQGLQGVDILPETKILAVADVVEAMASHRPYRPSLGIDAALEEIEKNRGTLYDKTVADTCLRLFREKGFQLAVT